MGLTHHARIADGLRQHLSGKTPVAVVQHASLPQQRHVLTTLAEMVNTVRDEGIASPAVIIVGDVLRGVVALAASPDLPLAVLAH